jgi:hypothetical protein
LIGWPLVVVVGVAMIAFCWLSYLFLKFGDAALELGGALLKELLGALLAELKFNVKHPALRLERFLLIFLLVAFLGCGILWLIFDMADAEGSSYFAVAEASLLLTLVIAAFKSGDFAKHLLE